MTDDLVKRLRVREWGCTSCRSDKLEAADRIEQLEKQIAASEAKVAALDRQIEYLEAEIENMEYEMCEMENAHD
jgi:septal ring factor EnvC (AmiA/AmiB activator)